ncbi:ammonium transporter [Aquihabitans sp. McL0605]|uniref:ammonium transporter n=1 Tax=Aquihabitans sp. McL0605 TaxID=3415671 RepID=UPI003CEE8E6D
MDAGNIAWVMISTALVLFMTPGLAFFYGGMVRAKNFLAMLMQNYFAIGLLAVLFALVGASLAFGNFGDGGWLGNFDYVGLKNIGMTNDQFGLPIPDILFIVFQMTFAIITPALITGATADRLKFGGYALVIGIWLLVVYAPVAHWAFGGGWLAKMGALDFAGGLVVHVNAGAAALAVLMVIGARKGHGKEHMPPHALPWTMLGTGILWFGWFGFNAGSALAADGIAAQAFINTLLAPAAAMLGWLLIERVKGKSLTTLGAASGAVAGMVAITPCAGFVGSMPAMIVGFAAGTICYLALEIKEKIKLDDALDVVAVHLVGGIFGSLVLGLFADKAINPAVTHPGLFMDGGSLELLKDQAVGTVVVFAFSFVVTYAIARGVSATIGLRVDEETEDIGLDQVLHSETAYNNL